MYGNKRRRHDLTLGDKIEVIRLIDNRVHQKDIAKIYNCSQSQISRIVSKRDDIIHGWEKCTDPEQKKRRFKTEFDDYISSGGTVPLMDQSNSTSIEIDKTSNSNTAWHHYWKTHSSSLSQQVHDKMSTSQYDDVKSIQGKRTGIPNKESRMSNQLVDILRSYDLCDVYCADEMALYYDAMPSQVVYDESDDADNDSGEKPALRHVDKKQISVFLACNVTGSDKRDFLLIEDAIRREPVELLITGCQTAKSLHAWMTSDIFTKYLTALDYDMGKQHRYVLLLVDNVPPHMSASVSSLEYVRVLYMRSHSTPFFHGLFYNVRSHYRKQILLKICETAPHYFSSLCGREKCDGSGNPAISLLEAVTMLKNAWESVDTQDIVQCFSKSGLCASNIHGLFSKLDDKILPDLLYDFMTYEQFEEYVNIDADVACSGDGDLVSSECCMLTDLYHHSVVDDNAQLDHHQQLVSINSVGNSILVDNSTVTESSNPITPSSCSINFSERNDVGLKTSVPNYQQVHIALETIRKFLQQHKLHHHNLHALEAQISSAARN